MIFDGKAFAREIEDTLRLRLRSGVRAPKIVSILVGNDPSSELYTRLKKQAAEWVGIDFVVQQYTNIPGQKLRAKIVEIGAREEVTGVMVQLPVPGLSREQTAKLLQLIPLAKDVDGLRWEESGVKPAAVRAVLAILDKIALESRFMIHESSVVVLGSGGAVGRPLVHFLRERGLTVTEVESDTTNPAELIVSGEVVISCVGKAGLITGEMIKEGAIVIDVGMSEVDGKTVGDMTQEVYQKASVAVAVPGGVGPVTIASLMENAVELYDRNP